MGRASRRKRANGGPGFFRREHLLAAATPRSAAARQDTAPEQAPQGDTTEQPRQTDAALAQASQDSATPAQTSQDDTAAAEPKQARGHSRLAQIEQVHGENGSSGTRDVSPGSDDSQA